MNKILSPDASLGGGGSKEKEETLLEKHERLEKGLLHFIEKYNFPLKIKNIEYSSDEEIKKAKVLRKEFSTLVKDYSQNELVKEVGEYAILLLEYIDFAVFEDDLTKPGEDNVRDEIETKLNPTHPVWKKNNPNPTKEDIIEAVELETYYKGSQLSRNAIARIYNADIIFSSYLEDIKYSDETIAQYHVLEKAFEGVPIIDTDTGLQINLNDEKYSKLLHNTIARYDYLPNEEKKKYVQVAKNYDLLVAQDVLDYLKGPQCLNKNTKK